jgi:transposase
MLYIGIDQHRKQLTVCVRNEEGDIVLRRQVSTEWKRVRAFWTEIRTMAGETSFLAILEVCGFNDWLLKMLSEYGCRQVFLVQPEKQSKKKTDRRDANMLGEILWLNRQRLLDDKRVQGVRVIHLPSAADAEGRQVTQIRKRTGEQCTRTTNRIRHLLRKHNLEQECPTKGLDTVRGKKWLTEVALGAMDRIEMDLLLAQWKLWKEQIAALDAEISKRQAENKTAAVLATIPGSRAYSSLALATRIGEIKNFRSPGSLPNFWGITPGCRNSGEATDRLGSITKQGSAMARFILGQLVLHVLRRDASMRAWYSKIKKRRGSKIARVAVMRRLATIIWHMVKNNEPYVVGGPPRKKLAKKAA